MRSRPAGWIACYLHNATPGMYLILTPESRLSSNIGIQIAREKEALDTELGVAKNKSR